MSDIRIVTSAQTRYATNQDNAPFGVQGTRDGALYQDDWISRLSRAGRVFFASDADFNDRVTAQTSEANTTPTFMLRVPSGTTAVPLYLQLSQAGTVAGGLISLIIEIDNADRYSSGGTAETVLSSRTDNPVANLCTLYSGATATNAYGVGIFHTELIQDVDPAVADNPYWHDPIWVPPVRIFLVGPAAWLIYTSAGTTAPTWEWSIAWAEIPSTEVA